MTIFSYIRILVLVTTSLVLSGCGGGGSSSSGASSSDPISMTTVAIHGLKVSFNASGYVEYQANQARYDSIIQKTMSVLSYPNSRHGRPAIRVLGESDYHALPYLTGNGSNFCTASQGCAWYGNIQMSGWTGVDAIYLVNMKKAILGHDTVLVHELAHWYHDKETAFAKPASATNSYNSAIDYYNTNNISRPFPAKPNEFLAYMMEAYHSDGVVLSAWGFPANRAELVAMNSGIIAALKELHLITP